MMQFLRLRFLTSLILKTYNRIENSKIALGLLGAFVTSFLVSNRDIYLQREATFQPQRAILLSKCEKLKNEIEVPLVNMTRGYIDYSIDIEGGVIGEPNIHPVVPGYIPQEKEEEIKWKIRKEQEPLFKLIKDTKEERQNILHIIQNYTINPQIEREWAVIDVALSLLPMEDRFISGLWMRHEALDKNLRTVAEWNQYIHTSKGKHESDKFIKRSPMAFRAYFFQYFIRKHFNKMTRLILVEQTGGDSYVPVWLKFPSPKDIPVVSKEASINAILEEHDSFRKEYLSEIERRSIGIHTF